MQLRLLHMLLCISSVAVVNGRVSGDLLPSSAHSTQILQNLSCADLAVFKKKLWASKILNPVPVIIDKYGGPLSKVSKQKPDRDLDCLETRAAVP